MKVTIEFYMFKLILVLNFSFNKQFWFFGGNFPKRILVVKNRKNEHNHSILHIWISLGIKIDFEQLVLTFWTKFDQKGYIESKKKKEEVNITIEFRIFGLVSLTNFRINWQFWFFWSKFTWKGFFYHKQKKWFLGSNLPKRVFSV